jgi:hypothetical protein
MSLASPQSLLGRILQALTSSPPLRSDFNRNRSGPPISESRAGVTSVVRGAIIPKNISLIVVADRQAFRILTAKIVEPIIVSPRNCRGELRIHVFDH